MAARVQRQDPRSAGGRAAPSPEQIADGVWRRRAAASREDDERLLRARRRRRADVRRRHRGDDRRARRRRRRAARRADADRARPRARRPPRRRARASTAPVFCHPDEVADARGATAGYGYFDARCSIRTARFLLPLLLDDVGRRPRGDRRDGGGGRGRRRLRGRAPPRPRARARSGCGARATAWRWSATASTRLEPRTTLTARRASRHPRLQPATPSRRARRSASSPRWSRRRLARPRRPLTGDVAAQLERAAAA